MEMRKSSLAPKKAKTAFNYFVMENSDLIHVDAPPNRIQPQKIKKLSELWKTAIKTKYIE